MNKRGCSKIVTMGLLMAVIVLHFTGCAATPQARVQKNPEMLGRLSAADQILVMRGTINEGMSRDAVYLAWGSPDSVTTGSDNGRQSETWRYATLQPVYHHGFGLGLGYGGGFHRGRHFYPGLSMNLTPSYVPRTTSVVRFRNGRVVAWEMAGR